MGGSLTTRMDPRRNVELKARDADPRRTLERAFALDGVADHGTLVQRDTYFAARAGRLKLRETEGEPHAQLIAYDRADAAEQRESRYRLTDVPDADALRQSLDEALGTTVVVAKRRRLLLWQDVRIHLDDVDGLGAFVELEAVAPPGSDLSAEHAKTTHLREQLQIGAIEPRGYAALLLDAGAATDRLVDLARRAMQHAHAPYSGFAVGAALRDERGGLHLGANVENGAYPQGQCAEASAIGALVSAGAQRIAEVAVMADAHLVTPCGGCRQRLSEFADHGVRVHLCGPEGIRTTLTMADLLPHPFQLEAQA